MCERCLFLLKVTFIRILIIFVRSLKNNSVTWTVFKSWNYTWLAELNNHRAMKVWYRNRLNIHNKFIRKKTKDLIKINNVSPNIHYRQSSHYSIVILMAIAYSLPFFSLSNSPIKMRTQTLINLQALVLFFFFF